MLMPLQYWLETHLTPLQCDKQEPKYTNTLHRQADGEVIIVDILTHLGNIRTLSRKFELNPFSG